MINKILVTIFLVSVFSFCGNDAIAQKINITVNVQPKAPSRVVTPRKPGPDYVLIPGRWRQQRGRYVYVEPKWEKQKKNKVWVEGYWKRVPGGHAWVEGYWTKSNNGKGKGKSKQVTRRR